MPDIEIREGVFMHEDGSVTVELSETIEHGHERFDAITMRRPRLRDVLDIDPGKIDDCDYREVAKFVSRISGISLEALHCLDLGDFLAVVGTAKGLLKRRTRQSIVRDSARASV